MRNGSLIMTVDVPYKLSATRLRDNLSMNGSAGTLGLVGVVLGAALGNLPQTIVAVSGTVGPWILVLYTYFVVAAIVSAYYYYYHYVSVALLPPNIRQVAIPFGVCGLPIAMASSLGNPIAFAICVLGLYTVNITAFWNTRAMMHDEFFASDATCLLPALKRENTKNLLCTLVSWGIASVAVALSLLPITHLPEWVPANFRAGVLKFDILHLGLHTIIVSIMIWTTNRQYLPELYRVARLPAKP
jgi:hypothetical protein